MTFCGMLLTTTRRRRDEAGATMGVAMRTEAGIATGVATGVPSVTACQVPFTVYRGSGLKNWACRGMAHDCQDTPHTSEGLRSSGGDSLSHRAARLQVLLCDFRRAARAHEGKPGLDLQGRPK